MTTKAAVLTAFQEPLELREYPGPPEPAAGETMAASRWRASVEPTYTFGSGQLPIPLPVILGHETAGRH